MSKLQALRERRKELAAEVRKQADKMNADGYTPSAEDDANWAQVNKDYNAVLASVEREETAARVETDTERVADRVPTNLGSRRRARGGDGASVPVTDAMRATALRAWCRSQMDLGVSRDQREACRAVRLNPRAKQLKFNMLGSREVSGLQAAVRRGHHANAQENGFGYFATLSNQTPAAGAYLIPPVTLVRNLEVNMLAYGGLLQVAQTLTTATGERMSWPTADDTSNKGMRLGASKQAMPAAGGDGGTDPTFGNVAWDAYKYTSKAVLVPYELLEDSTFDIAALLGDMLGERLGRIINEECTLGTGNSMPKGIVVAAGPGRNADKAGKITADDLMKLEHKLDPAYRGRPGVGYMMHDDILLAIRLLKNGDGEYLYSSGAKFGTPDSINGRPISINQSMSGSLASGAVPILYGDMASYKVRRVNGVRLYRLEERYRDTDQDGFVALARVDGNLLTASTPPVQKLVMP